MKDDDESVKLRKEHAEWMKLHGLAEETLTMAETLALVGWGDLSDSFCGKLSKAKKKRARRRGILTDMANRNQPATRLKRE